MPLFICDCCGAVDNTACGGSYWFNRYNERKGQTPEPDLCCKCFTGAWHNKFPYTICTSGVFFEQGESNFVYWMVNNEPRPGLISQKRQKEKYVPKSTPKSKNHLKKLKKSQRKKR